MKLQDLFEQEQRSKEEIENLLRLMQLGVPHIINKDLTVDVRGDVYLPSSFSEIPFQFGKVYGSFSYGANALIVSLKGSPSYVGGNFNCSNTNITSLEWAPRKVDRNFFSAYTPMTSLHNIHKQIKHIGGKFVFSNKVTSHILGVMLIEEVKLVEVWAFNPDIKDVEDIINRHLAGDRNIHSCQEELIEAGLKEYARL